MRSVSRLQPVCSMSKTTNSAPAVAISRPRPVLSNSKTIVPSDTPPARRIRLTVLARIGNPSSDHSLATSPLTPSPMSTLSRLLLAQDHRRQGALEDLGHQLDRRLLGG